MSFSPHADAPDVPALSVEGLVKVYSGGVRALDGLDLTIPRGAFFGLLGPNGAGKSTLIRSVSGLVRITGGRARVFGHDVTTDAVVARRNLGLAPQEPNLDRFLTVRETLVYHAGYFGVDRREAGARADELIDAFDLGDKAKVRTNRLSGGMKRRLLLARAFVHDPPLLILDEPTAGVDVELRHELWHYIRDLHARGRTILLTTHYLEEADALCDEIAMIDAGRIVLRGTPEGLRDDHGADTLEQVYMKVMHGHEVVAR
jgi:ABC-2 type transport system ATP-binding protein